jgi:hypothetical protein
MDKLTFGFVSAQLICLIVFKKKKKNKKQKRGTFNLNGSNVSGRIDPIQPIMLNGFYWSCWMTREIVGSCRVWSPDPLT